MMAAAPGTHAGGTQANTVMANEVLDLRFEPERMGPFLDPKLQHAMLIDIRKALTLFEVLGHACGGACRCRNMHVQRPIMNDVM